MYKETVRTTSSVEGYHSQLTTKLTKNGNFYKFLDCILKEDFTKTNEFIIALDGSMNETPRKKMRDRNHLIETSINDLENNRINLRSFLNIMTNDNNHLMTDREESFMSYSDDSDDDKEDEDSHSDILCSTLCIICFDQPRNIILNPCNHVKICCDCFEKIADTYRKNNSTVLCPVCRQIVQNSAKIYL